MVEGIWKNRSWTTLGIESRYSSRRPFDSFGSAENEWRLLKEHHRA
jgi:hypothetical protein